MSYFRGRANLLISFRFFWITYFILNKNFCTDTLVAPVRQCIHQCVHMSHTKNTRPRVYKKMSMLNPTEHEISTARKTKMLKK